MPNLHEHQCNRDYLPSVVAMAGIDGVRVLPALGAALLLAARRKQACAPGAGQHCGRLAAQPAAPLPGFDCWTAGTLGACLMAHYACLRSQTTAACVCEPALRRLLKLQRASIPQLQPPLVSRRL